MKTVKKPSKGKPRTATFTDDQIKAICKAGKYSSDAAIKTQRQRTAAALMFCLETAMRIGEFSKVTWDMVKSDRIHLPAHITKTKVARTVPLTKRARDVIQQLREAASGDLVLGVESSKVSVVFGMLKKQAKVAGVTFHDSRATALTRLAKVFENPMELAKISGHRDVNELLNTYYRPDEDQLVSRMANL